MALPPPLSAGAEQVVITGIGGPLGPFRCRPARRLIYAQRIAFFDALYERRGEIAFDQVVLQVRLRALARRVADSHGDTHWLCFRTPGNTSRGD
jgi:hypothetical protein